MQIAAKKILKKYRNLAKDLLKKTDNGIYIVFLKQVRVHPRDRLARKTKDDVELVK